MNFLKNHPFGVEAFFESSLVITYAVPQQQLIALLPPCLKPDTHNNQWGFVAAAMVSTRHLRPAGFPAFLGNNFFLIGYRIFVQYINQQGRRLRGLYILGSETDKKTMGVLGNIFTHYRYTTTDIQISRSAEHIAVTSRQSGLNVEADWSSHTIALPVGSPFADWKEARRFAGPLPFTFTYFEPTKEVLIIEGKRESWTPKPVKILHSKIDFIDKLGLTDITPANAFIVENIPYHWQKGVIEQWKP